MKKIFSLFVAALFCATMFAANVTLYFVNSNDWAAVHAYVFHDAAPWPNGGAWPGEAMTKTADQAKGKDVYSYTFDTQYEVIIFNNGGNGQQSSNEVWDSANPYYYEGSWYASLAAVEAAGEPETVTLYFVNDADWSTVNAYVYKNADPWPNGGAWPGATMTLTEEKANGKDIYKYTFNTQYDIVIFSENGNDSKKTGNLEWDAATPYYSKAQGQWYASAAAVPAVVVPAKFYITGDSALVVDAGLTADKKWNPDAIKSEKDTFVLNLKAGQYYKLKVAVNGTWIGENNVKGYNELSEKTDGLTDEGSDHNIGFTLKTAGAVQVIYKAGNPELFKVLGDFVVPDPEELPEVSVAGDFNGWTASAGVMTPAGDKKTASITVNLNKAQNWGFKVICGGKWLSNGAEGVEYKRGDAAKTAKYEGGEGNNIFIVADIAGDYTITWNYEDSTVAVAFPELPEITLEDGYYLVGIAGWSIYSLSAAEKFAANPGQEGEYMLANVTLALNDEFKVVEVQNKAFTANWYGSGGDPAGSANFKVTEDFVGKATIYFKPVLDESWNGHIWVAMEGQTALDNTQVGEKAVKMIENGQLVILKNGVRYSVLGVRVK